MFWLYNTVADLSDVVIQKQGLSIVDTRVPAIAMTLSSLLYLGRWTIPRSNLDLDIRPHGNQILLRRRHREARRLQPPDLHRIESAGSRWEMMPVHNK